MNIWKVAFGLSTTFCIILLSLFLLSNYWMSDLIIKNRSDGIAIDSLEYNLEQTKDSLRIYKLGFKALSKRESDLRWLTRVMYSETDDPLEAWFVGWAVRNRVDLCYNGNCTYKDVILDPYAFSSFNPGYPYKEYYLSLGVDTVNARWKQFNAIAQVILESDRSLAPFDKETTHFYSEISMVGRKRPLWAVNKNHINLPFINDYRFRFFNNIDE